MKRDHAWAINNAGVTGWCIRLLWRLIMNLSATDHLRRTADLKLIYYFLLFFISCPTSYAHHTFIFGWLETSCGVHCEILAGPIASLCGVSCVVFIFNLIYIIFILMHPSSSSFTYSPFSWPSLHRPAKSSVTDAPACHWTGTPCPTSSRFKQCQDECIIIICMIIDGRTCRSSTWFFFSLHNFIGVLSQYYSYEISFSVSLMQGNLLH